jgi:hypothetical protein
VAFGNISITAARIDSHIICTRPAIGANRKICDAQGCTRSPERKLDGPLEMRDAENGLETIRRWEGAAWARQSRR